MQNIGKYLLLLSAGLLCLIIYFTALTWSFLPQALNTQAIKNRITHKISQTLKAQVQCSDLKIIYGPLPGVQLKTFKISIPSTLKANLATVKAFPDITQLLQGNIRLKSIQTLNFNMEINLKKRKSRQIKKHPGKLFNSRLLEQLQPFSLSAHEGELLLLSKDGPALRFADIKANVALSESDIDFSASCSSSLGKNISILAQGQWKDLSLQGKTELKNFYPQLIQPFLPWDFAYQLGNSCIDLSLQWRTQGPQNLQTEFKGKLSPLVLVKNNQVQTLEASSLQGFLKYNQGDLNLRLDQMQLQQPKINISGQIQRQTDPDKLSINISGKKIDMSSLKEASLKTLNQFKPVRKLFQIVNKGTMTRITISAGGTNPDNFWENFILQGKLQNGEILIPKWDLQLQEVNSEVTIKQRTLHARDLIAKLDQLDIGSADLHLGLNKDFSPFRLSLGFKGKMEAVPGILKSIINKKSFEGKLQQVGGLKGKAAGSLIIEEKGEQIQAQAELRDFDVQASPGCLPFPVNLKGGQAEYQASHILAKDINIGFGNSSFRLKKGLLDWEKQSIFLASLSKCQIIIEDIFPWLCGLPGLRSRLAHLTGLKGSLSLDEAEVQGPVQDLTKLKMEVKGHLQDFLFSSKHLPSPISITSGGFEYDSHKIFLSTCCLDFQDSSLQITGKLDQPFQKDVSAEFDLQGELGTSFMQYIFKKLSLPGQLIPRTSLTVEDGHLVYEDKNKGSFQAQISAAHSLSLNIDISQSPGQFSINNLHMKDNLSDARAGLQIEENILKLYYNGKLQSKTLQRFLQIGNNSLRTTLSGDFQTEILRDNLRIKKFTGPLHIEESNLPGLIIPELEIEEMHLHGESEILYIRSSLLRLQGKRLFLKGKMDYSRPTEIFDMELQAGDLNWSELKSLIKPDKELKTTTLQISSAYSGKVNYKIQSFSYQGHTFKDLSGRIQIKDKSYLIALHNANLCTLPFQGQMHILPEMITYDMSSAVLNKDIQPTISCFHHGERIMTGKFGLQCAVNGQSQDFQSLINSRQGSLQFNARNGRIYRYNLLAKIISLLNSTEIFFGNVPDLEKKGMGYDNISVLGHFQGERFVLQEGLVDGKSMEIGFTGEIQTQEKELDLIVLVAPLKTVDRLIEKIPIISSLTGGNLVTIPFRVKGSLSDPKVVPLSPKAVGSELKAMMKRTLELPFTVLQPLLSP